MVRRRPPPIDFYRRHCQALNRSDWVNGVWYLGWLMGCLVIGVWYLGWSKGLLGIQGLVFGVVDGVDLCGDIQGDFRGYFAMLFSFRF